MKHDYCDMSAAVPDSSEGDRTIGCICAAEAVAMLFHCGNNTHPELLPKIASRINSAWRHALKLSSSHRFEATALVSVT
eukprot:5088617-Amphidinium_carterae.1